jgi:RNA polymerase sigma-54 factor|tara:strand:- start:451 stop:1926 length:1476 start_codon:yes stop_codon:yes gene_type:complete
MPSQGFQQVQKLSQSQVLAPQLRQSLKILQVPALELRSAILEELQSNPALEELSTEGISSVEEQSGPVETLNEDGERVPEKTESKEVLEFGEDFSVLQKLSDDWADIMHQESGEFEYTSDDAKRRQHFFDSVTGETSMQENLIEQARMQEADEETIKALEYLVGSLDDRGFMTTKASEIALYSDLPLRTVQEAGRLLKTLEPPGIGAEDVQECLLIQLRLNRRGGSIAAEIVQDHWQLLLRRRVPDIARRMSLTTEDVQQAVLEIARLDPSPGRQFSEDANRVIVPDITVSQDDMDEWQIELHNDYIPRLRISPVYKEMMAKGVLKGKDREFLQEKFRSGKFLISSIEQRQQTIERITREILIYQEAFFEEGSSKLKPLTMNQIAERVGVHETTVSRAIANKYIRTPHGIFELKYFFTPGYEGQNGTALSNTSVKERIAKIIEDEPSSKPLSDQKVVEVLAGEDVKIARRTVAKYREELGILPTNLRRQYA